jgi:hypothetical protein
MVFNGVDATWLDAGDQARLRAGMEAEIAALDAALDDRSYRAADPS